MDTHKAAKGHHSGERESQFDTWLGLHLLGVQGSIIRSSPCNSTDSACYMFCCKHLCWYTHAARAVESHDQALLVGTLCRSAQCRTCKRTRSSYSFLTSCSSR